jgi:hypothetical protein
MDRHLGATSGTAADGVATFGLHYQWGRKDPFPGANTATGGERTIYTSISDGTSATYVISKETAAKAYDWSIQNPTTFVANNASWFNTPTPTTTDNRWGHIEGSDKSIYDPCPAGYRVPRNGAWSDFTTTSFTWDATNKGRTATAKGGWYPAAGFRNNSTAVFGSVGANGFTWSATPDGDAKGLSLNIASGSVVSSQSLNRPFGFGVRCIKE